MRSAANYRALDLPAPAPAASVARPDRFRGPFAGASRSDPDLASWEPGVWSGHGAISEDRETLAARVHDLARNNGWASSSLTKYVDTAVGGGWIFISQPNLRALGIDEDAGAELAADIESWLDDVAGDTDCYLDRERTLPMGLQLALAMRHRMADGEALGVIGWRERGGAYATTLSVIDPDRLSNPAGRINDHALKDGVALDGVDFAPQGYWFSVAHPSDGWNGDNLRWEYVAREVRVPGGFRRQVLHAFEPTRAGERRGFPPLAPVLKKFRMLDTYDTYEHQAALLNAVMAAFVTSPNDHEELAKSLQEEGAGGDLSAYQQDRLAFHKEAPIRVSGAKVNFLHPGEDVKFTNPTHPNAVYDPFVRAGLRNIASVAGQTYEQFTGDLSQVNYSSIRAGLIEILKSFTARKTHFAGQFYLPLIGCLIEEGFARGRIAIPKGAPDFRAAKAAYCGGEGVGPGMGWVDPLKEAQAVRERLALRITSRRREAAQQGIRFSQLVNEARHDDEALRRAGIDPSITPTGQQAPNKPTGEPGEGKPDE